MKNLISAGELAKLANTTKRTIHYYDQIGILNPVHINSQNYRFYSEAQVLDYQKILLLTSLGISLGEIKTYLEKKGNLTQLFNAKKDSIKREIKLLEFNLNSLNKFQRNIRKNQSMVDPIIKVMKPFEVYYQEKNSSYAKIGQHCQELIHLFHPNSNLVTLAIFEQEGYRPKISQFKIGVIKKNGIKIKKRHQDKIKLLNLNPGKVLTYTHQGSGSLLSLFWKQLEKFARLNHLKIRKDTPDFEIYRQISIDPTKQFFEIYLPIE